MPLSKARDRERKRLTKARLESKQFQPKETKVIKQPEIDADGNPIPEYY